MVLMWIPWGILINRFNHEYKRKNIYYGKRVFGLHPKGAINGRNESTAKEKKWVLEWTA